MHSNRVEENFVTHQMLCLITEQRKSVLVAIACIVCAISAVCYAPQRLSFLLGWLGLVTTSQCLRMWVQRPMLSGDSRHLSRQVLQNIGVAFCAGFALATCLVVFPELDTNARGLVTLIILGVLVGAVANSAGHPQIYWAFCAPQIIPLALYWGLTPSAGYDAFVGQSVGLAILLGYTLVLNTHARRSWRIFNESCRIRFRENELNLRLQQALDTASQASLAKTRFLAAASHDLRQPLHTISFVAAALSMRNLDTESKNMVALLSKVTGSLSMQLESLLDISKLDAGILEPDLEAVSVSKLLEKYYAEFSHLAQAKGLTTRLHIGSSEMVQVMTDPALLQRVIMNLCQNALKFTETGSIEISEHSETNSVRITIADTGCGIAKELQQEVFQEFFQVANHERDSAKGLGLGLSIVQRLCKLLNIQLVLDSTPQVGTRIHLTLPRMKDAKPIDRHKQESESAQFQNRINATVLVIDDEVAIRQAARFLLEEMGCLVIEAEDLEGARYQCQLLVPQVIVADLRLRGELNGIEVVQALRNEFGSIPAMLVTGDTSPDRLRMAHAANMRVYHKPICAEKLSQEIALLTNPKTIRKRHAS